MASQPPPLLRGRDDVCSGDQAKRQGETGNGAMPCPPVARLCLSLANIVGVDASASEPGCREGQGQAAAACNVAKGIDRVLRADSLFFSSAEVPLFTYFIPPHSRSQQSVRTAGRQQQSHPSIPRHINHLPSVSQSVEVASSQSVAW